VSPKLPGVEFGFIRTTVPAGVVIGEFAPHAPGFREYIAVETGSLLGDQVPALTVVITDTYAEEWLLEIEAIAVA
jgi:hypothetical protein